jgi:hypothetical protein
MARKKEADDPVWEIYRLAGKAMYVGRVRAPTAEKAVARAIDQFDIRPEHQSRVVARPD